MQKLPVEYPADAAGIVIQIFGEASVAEKKYDLVEALWNIIGWTAWHEWKVGQTGSQYLFTLGESPSDAEIITTLKQFNDLAPHEKTGKLPFDFEKMRVWAQTLLGRLI